MLRGCFIFPLGTEVNSFEKAEELMKKLENKGEKVVIADTSNAGFSDAKVESMFKEGKSGEFFDALIAYTLELQEKFSYIIFKGYDIVCNDAVFRSGLNEKMAKMLGLPTITVSAEHKDVASFVLSPRIDIVASVKDFEDDLINMLINYKIKVIPSRMAQFILIEKAKNNLKKIVLPEGNCNRIVQAAAEIKKLGFAVPILLGDKDEVNEIIKANKLDLGDIEIINPSEFDGFDDYVNTYYELRKDKGVTIEKAKELMADVNYFGTMLVYKGHADGMVSGAIHTTAETIRPALQFIKTKPGISVVSGAFLMCFKNKVYVFGDCAVMPNPNPEQLAEIAASSTELIKIFEMEPLVAMISYATGSSGVGEDVDAVVKAVQIAREKYPNIDIEGPLQFDAAISKTVAKTKLPNSKVAGNANVFVFPDLNTGNSVYKAVQRAAEDAIAIGPVLQGLKKPVNDLSRGSTVLDIINTVAITALQANEE